MWFMMMRLLYHYRIERLELHRINWHPDEIVAHCVMIHTFKEWDVEHRKTKRKKRKQTDKCHGKQSGIPDHHLLLQRFCSVLFNLANLVN